MSTQRGKIEYVVFDMDGLLSELRGAAERLTLQCEKRMTDCGTDNSDTEVRRAPLQPDSC